MNIDSARVQAEVYWIRVRSKLHLLLRLLGFALVFLALFNFFGPMFLDVQPIAPYREPILSVLNGLYSSVLLPDLLVFATGLVLAWWG